MRLIVWRDSEIRHKYAYKLIREFTQDMDLKTIKEVDCSISKSIELLRGYTFDEVLWVGYEEYSERDFTAPMELLSQTFSAKKHHYCKPPEPTVAQVSAGWKSLAEAKKSPSEEPESLPQGITSAHALKYLAEQEKALRDSASLGTGFLNVEFSEEGSIKSRRFSHWEVYNDNLSEDYLDSLRYTIMVKPV